MGRLSGFRYREIIRRLKLSGFEFLRQAAGSHEIWYSPTTNRFTTIPNHSGDMPEGTLQAILRQAGITPEEFLQSEYTRRTLVCETLLSYVRYGFPLSRE